MAVFEYRQRQDCPELKWTDHGSDLGFSLWAMLGPSLHLTTDETIFVAHRIITVLEWWGKIEDLVGAFDGTGYKLVKEETDETG